MRFTFRGKNYRLRDDSVLYKIGGVVIFTALVVGVGIMNSWELGLL